MLARPDHPNLPRVTDFFTANGKHYIVMDFIHGETLEATLRRQTAIPWSNQQSGRR